MKYIYILYFVFAVFIIGFGSALLINGVPVSWKIVCILLIGVYFLYRVTAVCINQKRRREYEKIDNENDPANA
jgi:4-hydroxybenzoate polyprenyltransferase